MALYKFVFNFNFNTVISIPRNRINRHVRFQPKASNIRGRPHNKTALDQFNYVSSFKCNAHALALVYYQDMCYIRYISFVNTVIIAVT